MVKKAIPRTLVQLGSNSLVITLPKEWLNKNKLKKGDVLFLREEENNVSVSTKNKPEISLKGITINTDEKEYDIIKAELITAYLVGYDYIKLRGNNIKDISTDIKEVMHNLVGLEIIEETRKSLIAQELIDIEKTSIKNTMKRIDFLIRGMFEDVTNCKSEKDVDNIINRDVDVNRLSYLVFRILHKAAQHPYFLKAIEATHVDLLEKRMVFYGLENIGDFVKRLARAYYISEFEKKEKEEINKLIKEFYKTYIELMDAYYKNDIKTAYKISIDNDNRIIKCKKFLHKYPKYFNVEISNLLQNMSRAIRNIARLRCQNLS